MRRFSVDSDAAVLAGQLINHFRSANNQGLLVYLALNSETPQPRDVLATIFWPEETEKTARHNLRQALYHLRTIVGDTKNSGEPFLKVTRQTAQFNQQSDYSLDVHQFLQAVEGNDLETAVSLYQGDLLPGFTCDSLQFEEWLRQERESLLHLALEAMSELAQDHLDGGRFEQAQTIARRQLKLEPWRESAYRQFMRAYALLGDRSNALAEFEVCRDVLMKELGVEPEAGTVALYEAIKAGRYGTLRTNEFLQPPVKIRNNLLLLILDNFEHLLPGAALIDEVLRICPQVAILVTTRQRLNLASESRCALGGLVVPQESHPEEVLQFTAVQLFVAAANRVQSQFALTPDITPDVIQICRLVQGMPLGLLLAAACLELLSPAEIAAEIEKSLDFLAADLIDLPARQRSLIAVFERSWQMMTPAEKAVLAKLSVFRGGFTREAAEAVARGNLRILPALVNKSLLQRQLGSGRFTMHELLRQFAAIKRRESDANEQALLTHCRYFAGLVPQEVRRTLSFYPTDMSLRYAADRDNFYGAWDYALKHGLSDELSNLARGIAHFSFAHGILPEPLLNEAIEVLETLGLADSDPAMLRLRLVKQAALAGTVEAKSRLAALKALLPKVEAYGGPELQFWTYDVMRALYRNMDDAEILNWIEKMHRAALNMGDEILTRTAEAFLLWARIEMRLLEEDDEDKSLQQLHLLLANFEPDFANSFVVFIIFWSSGIIYFRKKQPENAVLHGQRALNIAKGWQNLWWISNVFWTLAWGYLELEEPEKARMKVLDCLDWHLAIGQEWQTNSFLMANLLYFNGFFDDKAEAFSILSMIYNYPDTNDHFRNVIDNEKTRLERGIEASIITAAW